MRRTQLQLEEPVFQAIRERAFREGKSMAQLMRELLEQALALSASPGEDKWERAKRAIGCFSDPTGGPIGRNHDQHLSE